MNYAQRLFYLLVLYMGCINARTVEKIVQISVIEERVDGDLFTHRIDTIDGVSTQRWVINDQEYTEDEFERRMVEADVRERKHERARQRQRARDKHRRVTQSYRALVKRLLRDTIDEVKHALDNVSDYRLRSYLVFEDDTIDSLQQLDYLHNIIIPEAESVAKSDDSSPRDMQMMIDQVRSYPERLDRLFHRSVEHACETSDDTRLLKDLLNIIGVD